MPGATVSADGMTATFAPNVRVGVRSTVAITRGPNSFYYFEARRSVPENLWFGVSGTADLAAPPSAPTGDSYMASYNQANTVRPSTVYGGRIGLGNVFGFAVDYREKFPVVYVIGSAATASTDCEGLTGDVPCVYARAQLTDATGSIYMYAYSGGDPIPTQLQINTGDDLANRPFVYSAEGVRKALRTMFYKGDRGFNMQWPTATGPLSGPTLTRIGTERAVLRQGDSAPIRESFAVSACPATGISLSWRDQGGTLRGSGESLPLSDSLVAALGVGSHTLTASVTDSASGRYAEMKFRLKVDAAASDLDDDGDGFTYSQEQTAGTDPGSSDTDNDGLSDAVEAIFGYNPTLADTDGNGVNDGRQRAGSTSLPERVTLKKETGVTAAGIVLSDDGLSAAFTTDLNQDCLRNRGAYTDPVYDPERCQKRAIRASYGVKPGEFRYFETRRLVTGPVPLDLNAGHGIIIPTGQIDPYCCLTGPTPDPRTPPALAVNSQAGGVGVRLAPPIERYYPLVNEFYYPNNTVYYGFAVDYTGIDPIVYVVTRDFENRISILQGIPMTGTESFGGLDVMPMIYGSPISNSEARSAVNFGLQSFHYDIATLRSVIPNGASLKPGVGIHERP